MTGPDWFAAGACLGVIAMAPALFVAVRDVLWGIGLIDQFEAQRRTIRDMRPDYERGRARRLAFNRHNHKKRGKA